MFQKKYKQLNESPNKSKLDQVLWFIENYLPQKKKRSQQSQFLLDKFESFTINKIKRLASIRSKSLEGDLGNKKVTFVVGNWALPYLNFLKTIKLLK